MNRNRYELMFERCGQAGESVFGAFLVLGDPDAKTSVQYLDALVEGGADMIELGIPFSDPVADGPVIQAAATRALRAGIRTRDCLDLVAGFRRHHPLVPIGILTYANIVEALGTDRFCREVAAAGADSLLIADVPVLEAELYSAAAKAAGLDYVMIAATNCPTMTIDRLARLGSGYTYCVARPGVTGADEHLALDHASLLDALAAANAPPPILGFGISTPAHVAEALGSGAAGVISGSAIVSRIAQGSPPSEIAIFCAAMKAATRHHGRAEAS